MNEEREGLEFGRRERTKKKSLQAWINQSGRLFRPRCRGKVLISMQLQQPMKEYKYK